jgi:fucose 4-O-acetylase-like acetyltransferase
MPNRILWIDYAKAIGIVLVVYGHVADGVMKAGIIDDLPIHSISLSFIYTFHIPLFFFLSGLFFFSSLDKKGGRGLLRNKLAVLIYPFVIWSLIDGGLGVALSEFTNRNTSWADVFSMFWVPRGQFWFLYTLFMVFALSIPVFAKLPRPYYFLILCIAGILYVFKNIVPPIFPWDTIANNWVFFVFGICFNQTKIFISKNNRIIFPLSLSVFLWSQWYFHFDLRLLSINADANGLALFVAIVAIVFIVSLCMALSRFQIKPLSLVGAYSLEIFLMHVIAGSGFRIILMNVFGVHDASTHLILGTVAGIGIPLTVASILKRANIQFLFTPVRPFKPSGIVGSPFRSLPKNNSLSMKNSS